MKHSPRSASCSRRWLTVVLLFTTSCGLVAANDAASPAKAAAVPVESDAATAWAELSKIPMFSP